MTGSKDWEISHENPCSRCQASQKKYLEWQKKKESRISKQPSWGSPVESQTPNDTLAELGIFTGVGLSQRRVNQVQTVKDQSEVSAVSRPSRLNPREPRGSEALSPPSSNPPETKLDLKVEATSEVAVSAAGQTRGSRKKRDLPTISCECSCNGNFGNCYCNTKKIDLYADDEEEEFENCLNLIHDAAEGKEKVVIHHHYYVDEHTTKARNCRFCSDEFHPLCHSQLCHNGSHEKKPCEEERIRIRVFEASD
eukprot:GHVP01038597.1.p1 GENE.GHVP01038597.1~~GHVP01038597.1.p1  ORF type:complete len:252 (+),score=57.22 GHVP01038597.1:1013-1768(+)